MVRCSNLNFDRIPVEDIPNDVIELYMERNNVEKIPLEINNFTRLKILLVIKKLVLKFNLQITY